MDNHLIYLDHAVTSFPKPREVIEKMFEDFTRLGVSPGRGGYDLAMESAELVFQARKKIAEFFGASDPERVIFTANATDALNLAIQGLVGKGDHVISTRLEHNSVLRPLFHLQKQLGVELDLVGFDEQGRVRVEEIEKAIKANTKLVICTHASNVLGTVQPVAAIAEMCAGYGIPLLIDTAQSAGHIPVEMDKWKIAALAFTGHKALLGPTGTGGLILSPTLEVRPTRYGGTGFESSSLYQPESFPFRLESGTLNTLGIFGLKAGIEYLQEEGMESAHQREMALIRRLYEGLSTLPGVKIHSPEPTAADVPVLTCTVEGLASEDVGTILDGDFSIAVRTGLHCAPLVHADLGTDKRGAVRFSLGRSNSSDDIEQALQAMEIITSRKI